MLLSLGGVTLWRSRRADDRLWWRYGRRALLVVVAAVVASVFLFPIAIAYVVTHAARAHVPAADLGAPYEDVKFTTSDGLRLRGWYIRSRNGAAVISFPGRASSQKRAKLLARHGYGVLLFDRRGEGASDGDPNLFGWQGERDIHAAVAFLQQPSRRRPRADRRHRPLRRRRDDDRGRSRVAGLSGRSSPRGRARRSVRDIVANPGTTWQDVLGNGVATLATAVFADTMPPADLKGLVPKISGAVFFVYGERGQPAEEPANKAFYAAAHEPKEIWEVPGSGHIGGIEAQPQEYERRVVGFFDRALLRGD